MQPVENDPLTIACICLSNLNRFSYTLLFPVIFSPSHTFCIRSMEAHAQMLRRNIPNVYSFGTGRNVKLPGKTRETPNVYPFGTSYQFILNDLKSKDETLYDNSVLFWYLNFIP